MIRAKWLIVYVYYGSDSLGHDIDIPKHIQYKTWVSVGVRRPFFFQQYNIQTALSFIEHKQVDLLLM